MKLAFITPTAYLDRFSVQSDIYLALAHLIDDEGKNAYARFHRRAAKQGRRIILDNGLFEGAQVDTESLLRRADIIGAQVVCAPDVLYDSKGTIKEFKKFIKAKQEYGLVAEVMGIPQASTATDWWDCFQFMELHSECDIIGLSILSIPKCFRGPRIKGITASRMCLLRQLYTYSDISDHRLKPMHLLGLGESYDDIKLARALLNREVVSNDSSSCFVHGYRNIGYREDGTIPGGKWAKKMRFDCRDLHERQATVIQHNINVAKKIAHGDIEWDIVEDTLNTAQQV
jgi:hypothetical protein